jgi:hypothetical protein
MNKRMDAKAWPTLPIDLALQGGNSHGATAWLLQHADHLGKKVTLNLQQECLP